MNNMVEIFLTFLRKRRVWKKKKIGDGEEGKI